MPAGPVRPVPGPREAAGTAHTWCRGGAGAVGAVGRGVSGSVRGGRQGPVPPVGLTPPPASVPAGSGQSESRAVVGRVGESTVLGCDLLDAHEDRPPLYVIEWVRFGFVLPIFIKFGLYSPRVDPEYIGESHGRGGYGVLGSHTRSPQAGSGVPCLRSPRQGPSRGPPLSDRINHAPGAVGKRRAPSGPGQQEGTLWGWWESPRQGRVPSLRGSSRDGWSRRHRGRGYPARLRWGSLPGQRVGEAPVMLAIAPITVASGSRGLPQHHPLGNGDG